MHVVGSVVLAPTVAGTAVFWPVRWICTAPLTCTTTAEGAARFCADAAADTTAPTDQPPPLDNGQLPPANPSSEASVQPESETLFY